MFANQMQIMLYVEDVPKSVAFWQSLGFEVIDEQTADGTSVVELAPSSESDARFVLYDKGFIEAHSPEVVLNSPSIMFFSEDITTLYKQLLDTNVEVGDLIQMEERMVFNFADPDGNYFAVSGK